MIQFALPLLGFCAFSGTGKTTLLKQLLPILRASGLHIGVIKHAHHQFDIDHKHKDSYELRKAGAAQMLIASRRRMALITEFESDHGEPTLEETLEALDAELLDLVLVEGFKHEQFPKIELHRPGMGKPLLCAADPSVIAVATDAPLFPSPIHLPVLDLNDIIGISDFILNYAQQMKETNFDDKQAHSTGA
jgi:molybdopterin-guanine dinucleotide biosynthesis protein B